MAPSKRKKSKEAKSKEAARRSKAGGKLSGSENIGQQQQADVQVRPTWICLKHGQSLMECTLLTTDLKLAG